MEEKYLVYPHCKIVPLVLNAEKMRYELRVEFSESCHAVMINNSQADYYQVSALAVVDFNDEASVVSSASTVKKGALLRPAIMGRKALLTAEMKKDADGSQTEPSVIILSSNVWKIH